MQTQMSLFLRNYHRGQNFQTWVIKSSEAVQCNARGGMCHCPHKKKKKKMSTRGIKHKHSFAPQSSLTRAAQTGLCCLLHSQSHIHNTWDLQNLNMVSFLTRWPGSTDWSKQSLHCSYITCPRRFSQNMAHFFFCRFRILVHLRTLFPIWEQ